MMKERRKAREKTHEQRNAFRPTQSLKLLRQMIRNRKSADFSTITWYGGFWTICWPWKRGQLWRQLLPPIGQLARPCSALHPLSLPAGKIRMLNRQIGQRRWFAGGECFIESNQFVREDNIDRYTVSHALVHGQREPVLVR